MRSGVCTVTVNVADACKIGGTTLPKRVWGTGKDCDSAWAACPCTHTLPLSQSYASGLLISAAIRLLADCRSKEGNVFISNQHAQVDPGEAVAACIPGPAYYVDGKLQLLSTHMSDGTAGFGKKKKAAAFTAKVGRMS